MKGKWVKTIHFESNSNKLNKAIKYLEEKEIPYETKILKSGKTSLNACFEKLENPGKEQISFQIYIG